MQVEHRGRDIRSGEQGHEQLKRLLGPRLHQEQVGQTRHHRDIAPVHGQSDPVGLLGLGGPTRGVQHLGQGGVDGGAALVAGEGGAQRPFRLSQIPEIAQAKAHEMQRGGGARIGLEHRVEQARGVGGTAGAVGLERRLEPLRGAGIGQVHEKRPPAFRCWRRL